MATIKISSEYITEAIKTIQHLRIPPDFRTGIRPAATPGEISSAVPLTSPEKETKEKEIERKTLTLNPVIDSDRYTLSIEVNPTLPILYILYFLYGAINQKAKNLIAQAAKEQKLTGVISHA